MQRAVVLVLTGVVFVCLTQSQPLFGNLLQHDSKRLFEECSKMCGLQPFSVSDLDELKSMPPCFMKCVIHGLLAKENTNTTTSPPTPSTIRLRYSSTTPTAVKPTTAVDSDHTCPRNFTPRSTEILPGDVSDIGVTFAQQLNGTNKQWVAQVNWTAPKGLDISSNWRGYVAIWNSDSDARDSEIGKIRCRLLPKNQNSLVINETDGWKYPYMLYLTVIALPTKKDMFDMKNFSPEPSEKGRPVIPAKAKGHHAVFSFGSWEGLVILAVVFLVAGFGALWLAKVYCSGTSEGKAEKKGDEMKHQLIVSAPKDLKEKEIWS